MASSGVLSGSELLRSIEASSALPSVAYKDSTNVSLDLGLCVAFDSAPVDPAAYAAGREAALLQSAQENSQLLVRGFFELPAEEDALFGPTVTLGPRATALPREKPVPAAKPPTRWEKFAKEKGILKKGKRERMLFDEPSGEYKPRFGYKRGRDESSEWLYELKSTDKGDVDHLERRELEKKLRVVHNKTNQAANLERAALEGERSKGFSSNNALFSSTSAEAAKGSKKRRKEGSGGVAAALAKPWGGSSSSSAQAEGSGGARLPAGIPSIPIAEGRADVLAGPGKHARPRPSDTKGVKTAQIGMAQVSTASMGKFDRKSNGEPVLKKDKMKRKRLPNEDRSTERSRDSSILARVLKGMPSGGSSSSAAVAHLPPSSSTYSKPGKPGRKTQAAKDQPRARAQAKTRDEKGVGKKVGAGRRDERGGKKAPHKKGPKGAK